jgi:hypothetical protein
MCYNGKLDAKELVSDATGTLTQVNVISWYRSQFISAIAHNENHSHTHPNTAVGKPKHKWIL